MPLMVFPLNISAHNLAFIFLINSAHPSSSNNYSYCTLLFFVCAFVRSLFKNRHSTASNVDKFCLILESFSYGGIFQKYTTPALCLSFLLTFISLLTRKAVLAIGLVSSFFIARPSASCSNASSVLVWLRSPPLDLLGSSVSLTSFSSFLHRTMSPCLCLWSGVNS